MINLHGLDKLTLGVFIPLFESNTLTKAILNQVCIHETYLKIVMFLNLDLEYS